AVNHGRAVDCRHDVLYLDRGGQNGWARGHEATGPPRRPRTGWSNRQQIRFLQAEQLVHLPDIAMRGLVEVLLPAPALVLTGIAVAHGPVDGVLGVPADVADTDPRLLGLGPRDLDEITTALLG